MGSWHLSMTSEKSFHLSAPMSLLPLFSLEHLDYAGHGMRCQIFLHTCIQSHVKQDQGFNHRIIKQSRLEETSEDHLYWTLEQFILIMWNKYEVTFASNSHSDRGTVLHALMTLTPQWYTENFTWQCENAELSGILCMFSDLWAYGRIYSYHRCSAS